jgi:polyhydroxyalkanoate synthesis repressor PhaR
MPRLIKKYKNRRLYDTEISQYITVDDVQRYVLEGLTFRVEDSSSQKDITTATLLQILVEMEAGPTTLLSPDLLRQLIGLAHHPMSQSITSLLEQMVGVIEKQAQSGVYRQASDAWNQQIKQVIEQWRGLFK